MSDFILFPCSRVREGEKRSRYRHRFGGTCAYEGIVPEGCSTPLHQLYVLDTRDPLLPVKIPEIRYLPLLYCFPYNAGEVAYQVLSDTKIKIHHLEPNEALEDFPYENYPQDFPERKVFLEKVSHEDQKILAFIHFDPFSGNKDDQQRLKELQYPFTQLGGVHVMWQGIPDIWCPNKKYRHQYGGGMEVFAVVWNQPVSGVWLWDRDEPDSDVQIIYQVCSECQTIHVCNRCS